MSEYYQDPTQNPRSREYKGPRANLKDLFPYLKDHKRALYLALVLSIVASALALSQPLVVGQLISAVEKQLDITTLALALVALILVAAIVNAFQYYLLYKTGEGVVLTTRKALVGRMLRGRDGGGAHPHGA